MPGGGERLHEVLDGYSKFLREKNLASARHQPYLVRWVREFLLFARPRAGYSFEQTLDLFLAEVGARVGVKPWPETHQEHPQKHTHRQNTLPS